ncbi:MAG: hypothetical protein JJU33_06185 [Phycisphaerales bacterium]|nr:hypothetical protein [Phycisphaerales bacterium]
MAPPSDQRDQTPPQQAERANPETSTPPAIARKRLVFVIAAFALSLVAGSFADRLGMGFIGEIGVFVGVLAAALGFLYLLEGRLRARLEAADWRLCTHCTYDLSQMAEEGDCPECGERYHHFDCRYRWKLVPLLGGRRIG